MESEKRFNRSFEQGPEPYPGEDDGFPDPLPEEIEPLPPDTVPKEELLDEEENKRQEDEIEETHQEEAQQNEQFSFPEEIKGDVIKENEYVIGLRKIIDKIRAEIKEEDNEKKKRGLREQLKKTCAEYTALGGMPIDTEGEDFDETIEKSVH